MSAGRRRAKARARRATRANAPPDATTRERLIHAARKLLEDGGYAAASVQAIAERAGLAAGAMYRHFPSKEALYAAVLEHTYERLGEASVISAAHGEHAAVRALLAVARDDPDAVTLLLRNAAPPVA